MIRSILPEDPPAVRPPIGPPAPYRSLRHPTPAWRSLVVVLIGTLIGLIYWLNPPLTLPPKAGVVMQLPDYVRTSNGFIGSPAEVTPEERRILPRDTEFARKLYHDFPGHGDEIYCSIVLTGAMQQSIHRPEICLVAQGWNIINQEYIPIQLESGHKLVVCSLTIQRVFQYHEQSVTVTAYDMYWFVGEKITTPSHLERTLLTSWDRIVHNRAHRWAYVTVEAQITNNLRRNGLDAAQTRAMMLDFIRKVVPSFQKDEMAAAAP
jgi:uncharacterized protein DUF3485